MKSKFLVFAVVLGFIAVSASSCTKKKRCAAYGNYTTEQIVTPEQSANN
ncbi:MAG: hypothetical protein ACXITV_03650 [Luteibaculaceae bacterium]